MFKQNKYCKWYFNIIENRKTHSLDGYTENHHIVPRSMGGTNEKSNLVRLSPREHFICHRLLTKITTGSAKKSMHCALMYLMSPGIPNRPKVKSSTFDIIKREFSASRVGFKHKEESKQKMSISHKAVGISSEHRIKMTAGKIGIKFSEEHRKNLSLSTLGRPKVFSDEGYKNLCIARNLRTPNKREISIDGITYSSVQSAANELGILNTTLSHRAKSPNPKFANIYFK
jgi:hypothetical protein